MFSSMRRAKKSKYTFCEKEKAAFENDPESHLEFRRKIEAEINLLFPLYTRGTDTQNAIHKVMLEEMLRRTGPGHEKLKLETSCEHFIKISNKTQDEGIKSVAVTQETCDDYYYHMHSFHRNNHLGRSLRELV
ncbi:hypothetical protein LTR28_012518 [Elasticomyces elasticus]|nr:hypothetical protein LTR28_012518 [Elasticomyces elasticus]